MFRFADSRGGEDDVKVLERTTRTFTLDHVLCKSLSAAYAHIRDIFVVRCAMQEALFAYARGSPSCWQHVRIKPPRHQHESPRPSVCPILLPECIIDTCDAGATQERCRSAVSRHLFASRHVGGAWPLLRYGGIKANQILVSASVSATKSKACILSTKQRMNALQGGKLEYHSASFMKPRTITSISCWRTGDRGFVDLNQAEQNL